jgi:hypothetical protein
MGSFASVLYHLSSHHLSSRSLFDGASTVFYNDKQVAADVLSIFQHFAKESGLDLNIAKRVVLSFWTNAHPSNTDLTEQLQSIFAFAFATANILAFVSALSPPLILGPLFSKRQDAP